MKAFWETVLRVFGGERRGLAIGAGAGLFFGLLYLLVGFWKMVVFALIVTAGAIAGSAFDRGVSVDWYRLGRWLADRWRGFK